MVDILLYQFRFAEALQKKSYGPNEQVLHQYKLSHSLHVLAVLQQATKKNQAWAKESLPTALTYSKSCPGVPRRLPGSSRVPGAAKQQCQHCCACTLGLAFGLTAI